MTISKKLAIIQIILYVVVTTVTIYVLIVAIRKPTDAATKSYIRDLAITGNISIFILLFGLAGTIIGIIQIVFSIKEQASKVYLAAGICSIIGLIPITSLLSIIGLILNNKQEFE